MPKVSRITDRFVGICCCHPPIPCISTGGRIIEGNSIHESTGQKVGRITSLCLGDCGHFTRVVSGASTHETGGQKVARVTSNVASSCITGKMISGAPNHDTN